ncbi:hypothetical protein MMMB2_0776 [Mycobacterium marinum MB2]|nr:hypothetical protein MMMB2_0776 [Mycobacterium marinum MB2]
MRTSSGRRSGMTSSRFRRTESVGVEPVLPALSEFLAKHFA